MNMPYGNRLPVEGEIAGLGDLARPALVALWQRHYRRDPPKGTSRRLLVLAIGYAMQAKRYGGLRPGLERRLKRIAEGGVDSTSADRQSGPQLKAGVRLIREWHGVTHVVEVTEDGFLWNGERHRSLSAIARAITGARWSGPRFFGTTSKGVL